MMRLLPLAVPLALAACDAPPRPPAPGPEARKAVDTATLAYADCITKGAETAPLGQSPGTAIGRVVQACAPARQALATAIEDFHQIGHPKFTADQLATVAEASIQQLEPQIRSDAIAVYVGRSLPNAKAE